MSSMYINMYIYQVGSDGLADVHVAYPILQSPLVELSFAEIKHCFTYVQIYLMFSLMCAIGFNWFLYMFIFVFVGFH